MLFKKIKELKAENARLEQELAKNISLVAFYKKEKAGLNEELDGAFSDVKQLKSEIETLKSKEENSISVEIVKSCEDDEVYYLCLPFGRMIFRNGKYEGWYMP